MRRSPSRLHLNKFNPDLASKCILVEKEKYPRNKLCGGALGDWTEKILEKLNINLEIPSKTIDKIDCRFKNNIYEFINKNKHSVVVIDRLDYLLNIYDFKEIFPILCEINDIIKKYN